MENKKNEKTSDRAYYLFAIRIIGDFSVSIAVPVVVAVLIGQYIDEKYGYKPLFTIIGFALSAIISAKIVYNKAKLYGDEYQKMVSSDKNKK